MADDVVIRAEGLGKKYVIGHAAERGRYVALRDVLVRGAHDLWRKSADLARGRAILARDTVEEFWALRDVSFEVKRGEVLGIIGRNGAGKSTLLKILSRITEPSEGRVTIRGRIASLLEVGTGFHPELTGRENIYLNGAILGMTRAEIRRKFHEIVAFAEVEKFLDTPVKRYSSGMYVRLAFAVAAHLEPEILVIDEVLAVGDAEFQKKCLGKISEVAGDGRTVLFVSHNLPAVRSLCSGALVLQSGKLVNSGSTIRMIELYYGTLANLAEQIGEWHWSGSKMPGDDTFKIKRVSIITDARGTTSEIFTDEDFEVAVEYQQLIPLYGMRVSLQLITRLGEIAFTTTDHSERTSDMEGRGLRISACRIPSHLLNVGSYVIRLGADIPGVRVILDWHEIGSITLIGKQNVGGSKFTDTEWPGVVSPRLHWTIKPLQETSNVQRPDIRRPQAAPAVAQDSGRGVI